MPASPPNFCVMTEQAVAVGQSMASMKPSMTWRYCVSGKSHSSRQHRAKAPLCIRASHRCNRLGFRAFGDTLQKATKSMQKSKAGCRNSTKRSSCPLTSAGNGSSRPMR